MTKARLLYEPVKALALLCHEILLTCKPTCRLKLDAAGEHIPTVKVAIYVVCLRPMYSAMQHKGSNLNTYYPGGATKKSECESGSESKSRNLALFYFPQMCADCTGLCCSDTVFAANSDIPLEVITA
jgi:hypothetical protein